MPASSDYSQQIRSSNPDERFAAWRKAGEQSPDVIPDLAKLAASEDPGIAKAAREAMTTMTHSVGKEESSPRRPAVVKQLLAVATSEKATVPVRTHALRLLSLIGGTETINPVAKLLKSAELREEAIFCLERIPGPEVDGAIMTALSTVPAEFRPRVSAALGHRKVAAASSLMVREMKSSNTDLAVAGARAFGRIGQNPDGMFRFPPLEGLTPAQATEVLDSQLRYADSQGNTPTAVTIYKAALARPEGHWQCAAIVGLSKLRTADAADAIRPFTKSASNTVRITAEKALKTLPG